MDIIKGIEKGIHFAGEVLSGWLDMADDFTGAFAVVGIGFLVCVVVRLVVRGLD